MNNDSRETKLSAAFVTLADTLIDDFDVIDLLHTLVEECADILNTQHAGLMLVDNLGQLQLVASTSEEASLVEVMQLSAGEGPCVECFTTGLPVTVGDIEATGSRWPAFRAESLRRGFRSVHAAPMRLRSDVIGTMNLFGVQVGELRPADVAVAQALADVATIGILQERSIREASVIARQLQHALNSRILIEQAKGVLSESAGLTMNDAFTAMRQYARSRNVALKAVAEAIIDRTLSLGDQTSVPPNA